MNKGENCPLKFEIMGSAIDTDYTFVGNLTTEGSWDVLYNLHMQLMDNAQGAVVKEGSRSWYSDPPGTGQATADVNYNVKELAKTFVPLDDLLFAYEGLPQTASVSPEKDPINAGEQMTIQVNVRANDNKAPQPWQWVIVGVKKGKILNGIPNGEDEEFKYYRFRAEGGTITLQYQAPEECAEDSETIVIYNTCNVDPNLAKYMPEEEIGRATFDITCQGAWLEVEHWVLFDPDCQREQTCNIRLPFELHESNDTGIYDIIGDSKMIKSETPCIDACYSDIRESTPGGLILGGKVDLRATPGKIVSLDLYYNICDWKFIDNEGDSRSLSDPDCWFYVYHDGQANHPLENIPWIDGYTGEIPYYPAYYTLHIQAEIE
jgi:hypothetical protein